MFARPSLRSRLASSGAEHPSDDSGGRSGARHAEEPRELRRKRPSPRCRPRIGVPQASLAESRKEQSHPAGSGNISTRAHGGSKARPLRHGAGRPTEWPPGEDSRILRPSGWRRATASAAGAAPRPRLTRPSSPNLIPSMARRGSDVHSPEMLRPGSGAPGQARPQGVHEEHHSGARPSRVTCFRLPPCCLSVPARGAFSGLAAGRASLACAWPTTGPCLPG